MSQVSVEKNTAIARIAGIVEKLIRGNSLFQVKLDKAEMSQLLSTLLLEKFSP